MNILSDNGVTHKVTAYAPQVGCIDENIESFREDGYDIITIIPGDERIIMGTK